MADNKFYRHLPLKVPIVDWSLLLLYSLQVLSSCLIKQCVFAVGRLFRVYFFPTSDMNY